MFAETIPDPNRRIFAGMLYKLDESVGKVVQGLKENNMLQDSIIVFTTDNGGPASGFNQNAASNYPLKGVSMIQQYFQIEWRKVKKYWGVLVLSSDRGSGLAGAMGTF